MARLAGRAAGVAEWARSATALRGLPQAFMGATSGTAAALLAVTELGESPFAIVCRDGRPDLVRRVLARVRVPTLFIVGGRDLHAAQVAVQARCRMHGPCDAAVVPGAGPLFEEPGAPAGVGKLTGAWVERHIAPNTGAPSERLAEGEDTSLAIIR